MSAVDGVEVSFLFAMDGMENHLERFDDPGTGTCHKVGIQKDYVAGLHGR